MKLTKKTSSDLVTLDEREKALRDILKKLGSSDDETAAISGSHSRGELSLTNRLFGSRARVDEILSIEGCQVYSRALCLRRYSLGLDKKIRSGEVESLFVEDWVLEEVPDKFQKRMGEELIAYENTLMSIMLYMLGGFSFPKDDFRESILEFLQVDVRELLKEPRLIFLLSGMSPYYILKYCYWRTGFILDGLMRSLGSINIPFHTVSKKIKECLSCE